MSNLLYLQTNAGKQRGILTVYILYSLNKKPKSGYEILSEIKEKTKGTWTPSKGTIYPLLTQMEKDELIKIKSIDKRSKHIYKTTNKGKNLLSNMKKHGKQMEEKFFQFRTLISEIFTKKELEVTNLIFEIRTLSLSIVKEKKQEAINILEICSSELKKLSNKTNEEILK